MQYDNNNNNNDAAASVIECKALNVISETKSNE